MYERNLRPDELMHYGVIGMKWGVRRYQNPDGTYTAKGKARLHDVDYDESTKTARKTQRSLNHLSKQKGKMDAAAASAQVKANKLKGTERGKLFASKGKEYANRSREISTMMNRTISTAAKKGQSASSTSIDKYVTTGKQKAVKALTTYMFGIPGYLITSAAQKSIYPERYTTQNRYKVR